MDNFHEICVEKQTGLDTESRMLSKELKELGLYDGTLRIIDRYIVKGIQDQEFEDSIPRVFADFSSDRTYPSLAEAVSGHDHLITELLPGQFNIRVHSAQEMLQLIYGNFDAKVKVQKVLVFENALKQGQRDELVNALINPVEKREGSEKVVFAEPAVYKEMPPVHGGFQDLDEDGLTGFHNKQGLAMTLADLKVVHQYFKEEGRDINETELKVLDTYWSDHCRHSTFNTVLEDVSFSEGTEKEKAAYEQYRSLRKELGREDRPETLMDLATLGTRVLKQQGHVNDLDESEEINACSIIRPVRTDRGSVPYIIQFKNETHTHPTEIEPNCGAGTCLGGAIRDPLAGRAYVYQAMRVTGAGDPTRDRADTLPGKLPQRSITKEAARGYSNYGSQIGVPAGLVHEIYHPGYTAKRMELGAVIASVPQDSVHRMVPRKGDLVLLVGERTGRDGVGGATGSSRSHDVSSMETSGAEVQKGNGPSERKLQRLIRNEKAIRLIKRCNDFGAGGVSVAVGELADSLRIDLDKVPLKYEGLTATETAVSESQERMAMVIAPEDLEEFQSYLDEESVDAAVIAEVTDTGRLVMTFRGNEVVNLKRSFLDSAGATASQTVRIEADAPAARTEGPAELTREHILEELMDLNNQSQKSLREMFDATSGGATVTLPCGGRTLSTESSHMAALIPVTGGLSRDASVMAWGYDPYLSEEDQYRGAYFAVLESLTRLAASGAGIENARLSFQEYFQRLGHDPVIWGKPMKSLLGALKAQLDFRTPSIGGKDSMSGTFDEIHVPPALISFAVNTMPGEAVLSNVLQGEGTLILIRTPDKSGLPDSEHILKSAALIREAAGKDLISACDTLSRGAVMTLLNMAWGNSAGMEAELSGDPFARRPQDFVLEVAAEDLAAFVSLAEAAGVEFETIGLSRTDGEICLNGVKVTAGETLEKASSLISPIFGVNAKDGDAVETLTVQGDGAGTAAPEKTETPKVLIPVFTGTSGEAEMARAFERAGGETKILVFRQRNQEDLESSVQELAHAIAESQILAFPGGSAAGDEPDGAGKYIAAVLRKPEVAGAIEALLQRKGLIIGTGNGFQALVRAGLLPAGRITPAGTRQPVLAANEAGRHHDAIVSVRVASNASPWLSFVKPGDVYSVPVSTSEGRFAAEEAELRKLAENGQIITQYVDDKGSATMAAPANPTGSMLAVEGLISPDGLVIGRMGHDERWQEGLLVNYPGTFDMKLFQSGVDYFRK